jgi:hypothetical protein
MNMSSILFTVFVVTLSLGTPLQAVDLPPELPLWEKGSPENAIRHDAEEKVRSHAAPPGSPSGLNRAFSSVSSPTYSIHRPENPNGFGLGDGRGKSTALWPTSFAAWLRDAGMIED